MSDHQQDPFDELMRRSLADEAARVQPGDGLPEIQARIRAQRGLAGRRPWLVAAGTAAIGTAAAIGVFTVFAHDEGPVGPPEVAGAPSPATSTSPVRPPAPSPTLSPTLSATPSPSQDVGKSPQARTGRPEDTARKTVPVYWLGPSIGAKRTESMRLYRTFVRVDGRPAYEALRVLTQAKPDDPDYQSPWTGAEVSAVTRTDSVITVDFASLPRTRLVPALADLAVQQLVYTVHGALGDDTRPVRITERGRVTGPLFGAVDLRKPVSRAQAADVQALVWIDSPANGALTSPVLTVSGAAAAGEGQVDWRAVNIFTKESMAGYAVTKEGRKLSPYAFELKLPPGRWEIEVSLESAEDGRLAESDTKTVTVK